MNVKIIDLVIKKKVLFGGASAAASVVNNIKGNDRRLLHSGIYILKKERKPKLFRFYFVTTVFEI